jgi:hypothetical protein
MHASGPCALKNGLIHDGLKTRRVRRMEVLFRVSERVMVMLPIAGWANTASFVVGSVVHIQQRPGEKAISRF